MPEPSPGESEQKDRNILSNRQQIDIVASVIGLGLLGKFDGTSFVEPRGLIATEQENEGKYLVLVRTCVQETDICKARLSNHFTPLSSFLPSRTLIKW